MVTRVGGLASGMDIDALVEKLMTAEKAPLNKLQQQKTTYEWQRDAFRSVNTKLQTFDTYVFDNFRLSSSLGKKTPTVSDTTKVGVTASSSATGSLSIDSVKQLATSARLSGQLTGTTSKRLATKDDTLANAMGISGYLTFTLKTTDENDAPVDKVITIDTSKSMEEVVSQLQSEGLTASINTNTGAFSFGISGTDTIEFHDSDSEMKLLGFGMDTTNTSGTFNSKTNWINETGTASKSTKLGELGIAPGTFNISVPQTTGDPKLTTISFKDTDTVDSLLKSINSSGAGVTALIGTDGQISITSTATGEGSITLSGNTELENVLGLNNSVAGKNSIFTVNGVEMQERSNKSTISGYEITLKQAFTTGAVSIESTADTDGLVDKIKEFVNTYNGLIADLNTQLKEAKYRDYTPLSAEQKKDMSENEIKTWEDKAKSGLLRNDSIIRDGLSTLRSMFGSSVSGLSDTTIDSFAELGITTSSVTSDNGKLIINEDKLRAAIEKDPSQVISVFSNTGEVTKENGKTVDSRGIAQRMRDSLTNMMKNIEKKAGKTTQTEQQYTIGKSLLGLGTRIDSWTTRLKDIESRYWKQFTAMETAINKANSQSSLFATS